MFPRKLTISRDGVFLDDVKVTGVIAADIKNVNPGHAGIEVALHFRVNEVDVQYKQFGRSREKLSQE